MNHWRGIAISACEQSGRAVLPEIEFFDSFEQALAVNRSESKLLLDSEGDTITGALPPGVSSVGILLGPEGGLTTGEIDLAIAGGFRSVSLGSRVLRTETAATAALAVVQAITSD